MNDKTRILEPFWGQSLKEGIPKFKRITFPDKDANNFAEFYGIMLGDGCLFSNLNGFAISGNKILDKEYHMSYIRKLIGALFGSEPSLYLSKRTQGMNTVFYSKEAARFLEEIGFPKGVKYKNDLTFPPFISSNKERLAKCIRGLMDTDGSLSSHPNAKIMIHLSITSPSLRKSTLDGLKKLGIYGGEFNKGIMIYGREKVELFYNKVGFSNYKNQLKYQKFKENNRVPSSKEIEDFIRGVSSL